MMSVVVSDTMTMELQQESEVNQKEEVTDRRN